MPEEVRMIAMRVREMREIAGLSVASVAEAIGLPEAEYIEMESGEKDIPIGFLTQVAQVFGVESTVLMTGGSPKLSTYALVRKSHGTPVRRKPEYEYHSLAENFQHKKVEPFEVLVQVDDPSTPVALNSHTGQEFVYVLEGELQFAINGKNLFLHPGDSIYFDSRHPHGMKALGESPVKFLAIVI